MNPGRSTIVRAKARETARFGRIDEAPEKDICGSMRFRTLVTLDP
jgi:hypothetical protein